MKVEDIMTRDVITVKPDAPISTAARLMANHGISGLPVVDAEDAVVGVISDGDLILRQKPPERPSWRSVFLQDAELLAREYQRAHGVTVAEVMTQQVISVTPDLAVENAAAILDQARINRVPVIADGQLVGILSRGDLVKALALATPGPAPQVSDAQLVKEMKTRIAGEPWVSTRAIAVRAEGGVLTLLGVVATETERSAIETMARGIDGCKGVENHLVVRSKMRFPAGL